MRLLCVGALWALLQMPVWAQVVVPTPAPPSAAQATWPNTAHLSGQAFLTPGLLALNNDPEMKDLAAKSGFELVNVGLEQMDAFMKERTQLYTEGAARLGLGKK